MTDITVHVHVHQDTVRADSAAAPSPLTVALQTAPALEWSPTLCGGKSVPYEEAEKAVAALGPEWRLATRREWCEIIDDTRHDPALDPAQHPGVESGYHWTSTPCPWARESAVFVVSSSYGVVYYFNRNSYALVRAVRAVSGQ